MFNDKACEEIRSAANNNTKIEMSKENHCPPLLTREREMRATTLLTDGNRQKSQESTVYRKDRRTGIQKKYKIPVESSNDEFRRTKSEGFGDLRFKSGLLEMVAGLTGRSSHTTRQNTEDLREISDFPVKPYYNDYSDHSTILIPKGLQVQESK